MYVFLFFLNNVCVTVNSHTHSFFRLPHVLLRALPHRRHVRIGRWWSSCPGRVHCWCNLFVVDRMQDRCKNPPCLAQFVRTHKCRLIPTQHVQQQSCVRIDCFSLQFRMFGIRQIQMGLHQMVAKPGFHDVHVHPNRRIRLNANHQFVRRHVWALWFKLNPHRAQFAVHCFAGLHHKWNVFPSVVVNGKFGQTIRRGDAVVRHRGVFSVTRFLGGDMGKVARLVELVLGSVWIGF